jgi:DNA polymerase-3 subunit delta'
VIGQDKIKHYLAKEIESDTLSHGYIIEGGQFMGKEFIARQIAEEVTTVAYINTLLPTEDRKLINVDDIRNLKVDAYSQTFGNAKKVYIIPNSDKMGNQSQNAFLKLLEEPPQDCVFILLATNRMNLLGTIRSRCTSLNLSRYTDANIREYLSTQNIEFNPETVRLCNGTINKYLYLSTKEFLVVEELANKVLVNIRQLHSARIFAIFKHVKKLKDYTNDLLDLFLLWYRDIYIYKLVEDESFIESVSKRDAIKKSSVDYTLDEVVTIISQIEICRTKLKYNCNLEMTINSLLLYMKGDVR